MVNLIMYMYTSFSVNLELNDLVLLQISLECS